MLLVALLIVPAVAVHGKEHSVATWEDSVGRIRTRAELDEILRQHKQWVESAGASGMVADLHGANLTKSDLSGANLTGASLGRAKLILANLKGAYLNETNLREANLTGANLSQAGLAGANLSGAILNSVDLSGANLSDAELQGALLFEANVRSVIFEPLSKPVIRGIAGARNLQEITYDDSPDALAELRKEFQNGGFRDEERMVTYAMKKREAALFLNHCKEGKTGACVNYYFPRVFFDLTCQYGMNPGRPLLAIGFLIVLFAVPYMAALKTSGRGAIWLCWSSDRLPKEEGSEEPVRLTEHFFLPESWLAGSERGVLIRWLRVLRFGFYFSVLSAFPIGWKELNVGNWIARLNRMSTFSGPRAG